ncbi:MAG TPA: hypothetical protein DIW81_21060, partial [Planctomycetaceae bacterium]|nr:hypothetical protein [Planctomycetaceae bacterium]
YTCPSDITGPRNGSMRNYGTSNYVGCSGGSPHSAGGNRPTGGSPLGMFGLNTRFNFSNIKDGTSNTFMIGERSADPPGGRASIWMGHENDVGVSYAEYEIMSIVFDETEGRLNGTGHNGRAFSSPHPGIVQFVMGDGSVRSISENIDHAELIVNLANRNDGNVIGEF